MRWLRLRFALLALATLLLPLLAGARLYANKPESKIARNVLESKTEGYCSPSGPIEATNCAYETVESLNQHLFPALHSLVSHPFFRYFKVDLYRDCPFWRENGLCMNRACGVETIDEADVPEKWRGAALSAVVTTDMNEGVNGCYFRDDDFCFIQDDATPEGQYIDLIENPERFTGYAGDSAHNVWRAIYQENCFGLSESVIAAARDGKSIPGRSRPAMGLNPLQGGHAPQDADLCEEKKLYYRLVSGMHASISIHICADYLDQTTGEWAPNLDCFVSRVATHPERISNVYFNAVLLLRAVARAAPYFRAYDIGITPRGRENECTRSQRLADSRTRSEFDGVISLAESLASGFNEEQFFAGPDAPVLIEQFKGAFRNVSAIMDCVGCDKCRLWGKMQVSGFGTALKILFALEDKDLDPRVNPNLLQRSEVVALFNTLHRVTESLHSVDEFRQIYARTQAEEAAAAPQRVAKKAAEKDARRRAEREKEWGPWLLAIAVSLFEAFRRGCSGCIKAAAEFLRGQGAPKGEL
ncbi:hypothetical protein CcaverHIS002_0201050 [Cutaneotrichosporon cavernicola]|uniref:Endoplasmic oxidoreductin n=1 Tax=Cutaneotrichosporon cavernicola TaxID=279322 RepID=A0AA48L2G0_9TREE|nr:uncharacterized protein CcaverHIS019_0201100 [Cutaneotrichosporon cavernicola]BEI80945.1 hypothetical protein CcaverHIS002_0201050 [Cutaneotrichosporon cavernicola]BEI88748.1 hypothetical protein CcaverHIS019_0201100 [Cutaneotrichosporon cavernicola]